LVALKPEELSSIPITIGVAAGQNKIAPICAALRGRHVRALVLDEATAQGVLKMMGKSK
jgi:DNA-binding transcriptional regulator LsrR (DeoR family)